MKTDHTEPATPGVEPPTLPTVPTRPPTLPERVGRMLLAYASRAGGTDGEALVLPTPIGAHLCRALCAAGYFTAAPQNGIFASRAADRSLVVSARPVGSRRLH